MQDYADQLVALQPLLVRVARKKLRNLAWAEDAVSETLLAAWARPDAFAGRSTLKTWLVGILLNQSVNQIRMHTRECQVASFDGHAGSEPLSDPVANLAAEAGSQRDDPQECLRQRQFIARVDRCLRSLPQKQARAFIMRHGQEEDCDTICTELGVTRSNLDVMLHRARHQLRTALSA